MQDYEVLKEIGSGSFGKVSKVRRKWDNKEMACKEINYKNLSEKEKSQIVAEVNILRELQHPFIVRYFDRIIEKTTSKLYIMMELCSGGDLGKVLLKCQRENSSIHEDIIWKIFAQISSALKDCHRHIENNNNNNNVLKPILHRDIKPANIFLDSNQNIKIGDFGLAKELSTIKTCALTNVGTPFYMSPEIINGKSYDERSDIWALGCLLYELASLKPPHHDAKGQKDLVIRINSGKVKRIPNEYSNELWKTIQDLMAVDLSKRPRIEEIMNIKVPAFVKHLNNIKKTIQDFKVALAIEDKQREYKDKETDIDKREKAVIIREQNIELKEKEILEKESQLIIKENNLKQLEINLLEKEKLLNNKPIINNTNISNTIKQINNPSFNIYNDLEKNECDNIMIIDNIIDVPANNTRRKSITVTNNNTSNLIDNSNNLNKITDGVNRAKQLLYGNNNNNNNKENQHIITSNMPPPPPISNSLGIMKPLALNKRPLSENIIDNNISNIANNNNNINDNNTPSKRQKNNRISLNFNKPNILNTAAQKFSFISNQQNQQLKIQPSITNNIINNSNQFDLTNQEAYKKAIEKL